MFFWYYFSPEILNLFRISLTILVIIVAVLIIISVIVTINRRSKADKFFNKFKDFDWYKNIRK